MIATIVSETPICIVGFLTLLITKGIFDWNLAILLSIRSFTWSFVVVANSISSGSLRLGD